VTAASIDAMWELWQRRADTLLVPGHDMPMVLRDGAPVFVGKREAAITSWFGDDLDTMTRFELTVGR
jgi:hypothetical protein